MTEIRERFGRAAYAGVVAGLAAGIFFDQLRQAAASTAALGATCVLLVALPVVNVVFVIADEVRRRDWTFALMGAGVLALVGASLVQRLFN